MSFGFPTPRSIYTQSQVSASPNENHVQNGGLFTKQECRTLAKNIIDAYDGNNDGVCETMEVAKWLVDCYRAMNKTFQPTATDIASYIQIVDRNKSGKISVQDLQAFILKYFSSSSKN